MYKYAKVSFDLLTVYADEISLDGETLRLNARGRVAIEDGKERRATPAAVIDFKDDQARTEY